MISSFRFPPIQAKLKLKRVEYKFERIPLITGGFL
jgi:hypothetical protein